MTWSRRRWPAFLNPRTERPGGRPAGEAGPLLDSALLSQLELLSLDALETIMSVLEGSHPGAPRTQFADLTDYRSYQPGDDLRLIDWNAYARLDELFVRTSSAHEGLTLTLLVDCSRSMEVPGYRKLWHAKRLAAAFGAVALLHSDAVRVCALTDGTAWPLPALSGRTAVGRLLADLEWLPAGGGTQLADSVRACRLESAGPGFAVLLSDLLVPDGQDEAVSWLGPYGTVLHVIDPGDADPFAVAGVAFAGGAAELRDSETGEVLSVAVTPALRRRYAERFQSRCEALSARCAAAGVHYMRAETTTAVADLLFRTAMRAGKLSRTAAACGDREDTVSGRRRAGRRVAEVTAMSVRHKSGSKAYRDELRGSLQALGAQGARLTELVARDLQQRGARPRRAWREAAELSQRQAAERFNQLTGNPRAPMTGNRIGDFEKWPDGGARPTMATLKILADIYGTTWDQLVDSHDLAHMSDRDRLEYVESNRAPARPAPVVVAQPPRRRGGRDDLLAEAAGESAEFGEWVAMSEVADAAIEQYRVQVRRLARDFDLDAPLVPLLLETRRLRDRVTARLRGHTRLGQARDLYLLAAQVCGLLAWETADLGDYRAADTHAWTAWMCAEQAGHDGARAWVRATQSKIAYWDDRYTESAQLAEDGLSYGTADSSRVMLALFRARALARAGRRDDARQALNQAEAERAGVSAPDLLGGMWGMPSVRYHGNRASTQMLLEAPAQVLDEAQQVITLTVAAAASERHPWMYAHAHLDTAIAYLRRSELDGAVTALRPVLDLPPHIRNDPMLQDLARVRRLLAQPMFGESSLAMDAQEEIEAFRREALPVNLAS
jgi:transcriptional regulator with XRE-family HTH domain